MTDDTGGGGFTLLHTADWQIGMRASHVGEAGDVVRAARLESAARVVDIANERRVDLLVLAGDTFEDNAVPRADVQRVVDILRKATMPVLVLPGNHDPFVPRSVYSHPAWVDAGAGIVVADDCGPYEYGPADVYCAPIFTKTSNRDPTLQIPDAPAEPDGRIRIGVGHGSLRGAGAPDDEIEHDFPIDRAVVTRAELDYLALGHWHGTGIHEVNGVPRLAYSATHEQTKFGEKEPGAALLVRVPAPGVPPVIERIPTGVLTWEQRKETLAGAPDLERIRKEIDAAPADARTRCLLDLELSGVLDVAAMAQIADLQELASARYLYARVKRDDLRPAMEGTDWLDELPPGVPQAVGKRLMEALRSDDDDTSEAALRALELLHEIAGEADG